MPVVPCETAFGYGAFQQFLLTVRTVAARTHPDAIPLDAGDESAEGRRHDPGRIDPRPSDGKTRRSRDGGIAGRVNESASPESRESFHIGPDESLQPYPIRSADGIDNSTAEAYLNPGGDEKLVVQEGQFLRTEGDPALHRAGPELGRDMRAGGTSHMQGFDNFLSDTSRDAADSVGHGTEGAHHA